MSKFVKKFLPVALGIAAPGIGSALGMSALASSVVGGALGGIAQGGGLKGALMGGLTGGAGNYLGSMLGSTAGSSLNAFTPKGELGNILGDLGSAATKSSGGLTTALKAGIGNLASGDGIANAASSYMAYDAQDEMKKKLLEAQNQAKGALSPYLAAGRGGIDALLEGFDPSQLETDAGYQFRLSQGQDALEKSLAARGLSSSGAAMKAAQEFGQGTAAQAYNDAFNQWFAKNSGLANYGQNATGTLTDIYGNMGNIGANSTLAKSNILSNALSGVLSGSAGKKIIGYDESGNPIYAE